jgi:hypothetical protein
MQKFSKEDIDGTRNYFRDQGFEEVQVELGSRKFSYFVMPQSLEPNLENFVYRATGEKGAGYVFGISDNVREDFRQYAVAHEFIEFTEIGMDTPDRCVKALEEELKLVPEDIKPEYIAMRRKFFKELIDYCGLRPEYTQGDLEEFRNSLNRLEELAADHNS